MSPRVRIQVGVALIVSLLVIVLVGDNLRQNQSVSAILDGQQDTNTDSDSQTSDTIAAGAIPIYVDGEQIASIDTDTLDTLEQASFVDDEEGKTQKGWYLRDLIPTLINVETLLPESVFVITSTTRDKSALLTWSQIDDPENFVLFDVSGRGTLKLVSKSIEDLNQRDEWVQDVDQIEISTSPDGE